MPRMRRIGAVDSLKGHVQMAKPLRRGSIVPSRPACHVFFERLEPRIMCGGLFDVFFGWLSWLFEPVDHAGDGYFHEQNLGERGGRGETAEYASYQPKAEADVHERGLDFDLSDL